MHALVSLQKLAYYAIGNLCLPTWKQYFFENIVYGTTATIVISLTRNSPSRMMSWSINADISYIDTDDIIGNIQIIITANYTECLYIICACSCMYVYFMHMYTYYTSWVKLYIIVVGICHQLQRLTLFLTEKYCSLSWLKRQYLFWNLSRPTWACGRIPPCCLFSR